MIDRAEIKAQARAQLQGKVWPIFGCMFLANLVMAASSMGNMIPIVGALIPIVIEGCVYLGITQLFLNITYGDKPKIEDVFSGFKNILNASLLFFLVGLFICLWSILLVIPGIIMCIAYSMSWFIMCENPDMSAMDCIRESKAIMQGHKMEYFVLLLSFIGWSLLGVITFGIAYIYVTPYLHLSVADFYHRIKNVHSVDEGYTEISSEPVLENANMQETFAEQTEDTVIKESVAPANVEPAFELSDENGETIAEPSFPDIPSEPDIDGDTEN